MCKTLGLIVDSALGFGVHLLSYLVYGGREGGRGGAGFTEDLRCTSGSGVEFVVYRVLGVSKIRRLIGLC